MSGKLSRSSSAFSKMSNVHGVASEVNPYYGIVMLTRERKK